MANSWCSSGFRCGAVIAGIALSGGLLALLGGVLFGAGTGFLGGTVASIIGQGFSTNWNWNQIDPMKVLLSGGIGAVKCTPKVGHNFRRCIFYAKEGKKAHVLASGIALPDSRSQQHTMLFR